MPRKKVVRDTEASERSKELWEARMRKQDARARVEAARHLGREIMLAGDTEQAEACAQICFDYANLTEKVNGL
jgi:hypothetical protein